MTPLWLFCAPPFGPALWEGVRRRLEGRFLARTLSLVDAMEVGSLQAARSRLRTRLGEEPPGIVVAHGLAVPYLLELSPDLPAQGLALCNGPIGPLHPLWRGAAIAARWVWAPFSLGLRPGLGLPILASSVGLRRAVRNPYVMDRDTVVAVCGPALSEPRQRRALRSLIAGLPEAAGSTRPLPTPLLLIWGDEDSLHPPSSVDWARIRAPRLRHHRVPGGRLMHPVERPWETAEAIETWISQLPA